MAITAGNSILASDFVGSPSGAGDSGKVPKLDSTGKIPTGFMRFGGDGSDGALSISSGTTTIDCANAAVVIKNYTSISITGTGKLAFSNPATNGTIIVLKSQGNVTLTSSTAPMIDCSNMGSAGGAAETSGSPAYWGGFHAISAAGGGTHAVNTTPAAGATGGSLSFNLTGYAPTQILHKYPFLFIGGGGGGGGQIGGGVAGVGGRGGGCLVIECAGSWNFTTSGGISVGGTVGTAATSAGGNGVIGSGGGGGGGGFFLGLYNTLTANSGTVTVAGAVGGAGAGAGTGGNSNEASAGAGGGSKNAGVNSSSILGTNQSGVTGSTGGDGYSLIAANKEYA